MTYQCPVCKGSCVAWSFPSPSNEGTPPQCQTCGGTGVEPGPRDAAMTAIMMDEKEFLLAVRNYIENSEERIEGEWGSCRSLDELIAASDMPPLYAEVLRRIDL